MKRIVLSEYGRLHCWCDPDAPPPDTPREAWLEKRLFERLYRLEKRLSREHGEIFKWHRNEARPTSWVGVIQMQGLQLEIVPKIDAVSPGEESVEEARRNLLYILTVAGYVPIRFRETASLVTREAPLGETLAAIFAQRLVAELLRGPERTYRKQEENLRLFKGKLMIAPHVRRNSAHRARFVCEYDEFTQDNDLNRVFKTACRILTASMRRPKTLEQLGHALILLEDVEDVNVTAPLLDRIVIDRKNARFEELFVFCRMLLEGHAPGVAAGGTRTYSLLFDMNRVFEEFVAAFLRKHVMPRLPGHQLVLQGRRQKKYLVREGARGLLQLKPDLAVISPSGEKLVIDTKWKRLRAERENRRARIASADLYQLYAYANRFGARRGLLLYPKLPQSKERDFDLLDTADSPTGHHLGIRFLDLHRNLSLSSERQNLAAELKTLTESAFQPLAVPA